MRFWSLMLCVAAFYAVIVGAIVALADRGHWLGAAVIAVGAAAVTGLGWLALSTMRVQ